MSTTVPEVWARLFTAAGLQAEEFKQVESGWIPAPGWDARGSWSGTYPSSEADGSRTPVRVEAAAWRGQPVYFEVVPAWRQDAGEPWPVIRNRVIASQSAIYLVLLAASAPLAWRNVRLGRGDRRGAFRIAVFLFASMFLNFVCKADHVTDLAEFTLLLRAVLWPGFLSVSFWAVYMALEPYVRRRWPQALISWTRVLSGELRDPVAGGHILIGTAFGATIAMLITAGVSLAGVYGFRLPSVLMLWGGWRAFAEASSQLPEAVIRALFLLFITFFFKAFFRREWIAVIGVVAAVFAFDVSSSPLSPAVTSLILIPAAMISAYVLLRTGLLAVVVGIYTAVALMSLPISGNLSSPGAGASILMLCAIAALALFGFHSTIAGRSLLKVEV